MLNGWAPKKEFDTGSLVHKLVLGEGADIVVVDAKDWRTKAAQEARDAAREEGKIPALTKDMQAAQAITEQVYERPIAANLFSVGEPEVSMYATDIETGVRMRGRVDWLRPDYLVDFKGLALDTPIPTPTGWATMGSLRVGDHVFGSDGRPCRVTAKSEVHFKDCYRMKYDDGTSLVCDHDHLWAVTTGRSTTTRVIETSEISRRIREMSSGVRPYIALPAPLELDAVDLPIDPYVLGAWLGDGSARDGRITKPDVELFDHIAARGYKYGELIGRDETKCRSRTIYGLSAQLGRAGLLGAKTIPDAYLRGDTTQRLDLLRGLMDTDGTYNKVRSSVVFGSVDKAMAEGVRELALSLGERAVIHEVDGVGYGKLVHSYRVSWRPQRFNPFLLSRKARNVTLARSVRSTRRVIQSCDRTVTVPTQCIQVDSPDRTYLCGDQMVPTHNTTADADPRAFERSIWKFGYAVQAWWYLTIARAAGHPAEDFLFVAASTRRPFLVTEHRLTEEYLQYGESLARRALRTFTECRDTGEWPGHPNRINVVSLPAWAGTTTHHDIETEDTAA
ncbi:PD-(D/E)XK nuclease-like domain-containing protein [Tsukamurella tyrosinosolvens]|uniref:PD-(D/E)XK nuclease-like domain-containing protein n=1 Tax=Tsukamurella tyrosinosolvens TaxID=57704 RepID=UPI002DD4207E|nr:PD-(D/E)XK nuclease-like domain-containing protein [Tsukamurella tyrosinosolvens]MEC4616304.1 PD-(D/E)XK nuclease-like domain-containing protein [Tsukamurella tyrosinosolvens]